MQVDGSVDGGVEGKRSGIAQERGRGSTIPHCVLPKVVEVRVHAHLCFGKLVYIKIIFGKLMVVSFRSGE
jgi:hypothetical protein